jgi:hypothetical protein
MLPSAATPSVLSDPNRRFCHSESGCQFHFRIKASDVEASNLCDVNLSELRSALSAAAWISSLGHHVSDVVLGCAEKQVVWVHALPVVATMTDVKAVRYCAAMKNPRRAMGPNDIGRSAHAEPTVVVPCGVGDPIPTIVVGHNVLGLKPNNRRLARTATGHSVERTILPPCAHDWKEPREVHEVGR